MSKQFLITLPSGDDAEYYLSIWSKEIIDVAAEKGFKVVKLEREKANRQALEGHLKSSAPDFLVFNGHGDGKTICGHMQEPLIEENSNHALLKGTVAYARSCYTLSSLGKASVGSGCTAFIGYSAPFVFVSDPNSSARPLKDCLAYPCLYTSNMVPLALLKGANVETAVQKAKEKMAELISEWETRDEREATFVASCLFWDMNCLNFEGTGKATI